MDQEGANLDEGRGTGRGGKRPGAGRKPAPVALVQYAVRVPEADKPFLLAVPEIVKRALSKIAETERQKQANEEKSVESVVDRL